MPEAPQALWFAGLPGTVFVFRVNRRPWPEQTLFTPSIPDDAFEHFARMLAPGYEIVTGRRHQRTWRVGGVHTDRDDRTLVGKLGWEPRGQEVVPQWSEAEKDWLSETASPHGGRVVPFGFDGDTRLLAILRDPKSPANTVAAVFEQILRENERELEEPSTEWSVEPILDKADFLSWLATLDTVRLVSFTAKLPNPEPRDAFRELAERMEARRATSYTETLRSDRDEGLVGIPDDRDIQQAIGMGEHGLAKFRGEGLRGASTSQYNQSNRVARERIEQVPEDWQGVWAIIKGFLKGRLRRLVEEERTP
jgi:hypothetical protein